MKEDEKEIEKLQDLLIQKICEIGDHTFVIGKKNIEIEKLEKELSVLKNELYKIRNKNGKDDVEEEIKLKPLLEK